MTFYAYGRRPDGKYQERFGLDFEDFALGQRFAHRPGVTLSQQDILAFHFSCVRIENSNQF